MTLPSLSDVFFITVVLVPGFLTFSLIKTLGILDNKISDFSLTVWSLSCSLGVLAIFGALFQVTDIEVLKANLLSPVYLAGILGTSAVLGTGIGLTVRHFSKRRHRSHGSPWTNSMLIGSEKGCWVFVYTEDGKEYGGSLHRSGLDDNPSEISIREPIMILRDSDFKVKREIPLGKEILFREKDIRRVVFDQET